MCRVAASHNGGVSISEEDGPDSDASSTTDANEHMAAADMQITRCQQDRINFTESLINLVSGPILVSDGCACMWLPIYRPASVTVLIYLPPHCWKSR